MAKQEEITFLFELTHGNCTRDTTRRCKAQGATDGGMLPCFGVEAPINRTEVFWGPKDKPARILRELDKLNEKLSQLGYMPSEESEFQHEWGKYFKEDKKHFWGCGWDTERCCVWFGELKKQEVDFYTGLLAATAKLFPNITGEWGVEYPARYFAVADYSGDINTLCDDIIQALDILERGVAAL
jgi:hypothetical protein